MILALVQTALACSCGAMSLEGSLASADVVFRGTVVSVEPSSHPAMRDGTYTMIVSEVWKGSPGERVTLSGSGPCTVASLPEDTQWVVFAWRSSGGLTIPYCSGSEEVGKPGAEAIIADAFGMEPPPTLIERLGAGRPPR